MKKIYLLLVTVLLTSSILGCSNESGKAPETTLVEESTAPDTTAFTVEIDPNEKSMYDADFDYDEYVKLCDYKNINIAVVPKIEITDEYIEELINSTLVSYDCFTRDDSITTVLEGYVVSIFFESLINGEEYSGGTQEDFCFIVGLGNFIPDLENALIGRNVGDSFDISVTYPEDYTITNLAGKNADFSVTINYLATVNELNDDNVKIISENEFTNVEEYRSYVKNLNLAISKISHISQRNDNLWTFIQEKSEIVKLPACDRMDYCEQIINEFTAAAEGSGYSYEDFLTAQGYTANSFLESLYNEYSVDVVTYNLLLRAICAKEGIPTEITDEEYLDSISDYMIGYGYDSLEDFENDYGVLSLKETIFFDKVMAHIAALNNLE